MIFKRSFKHQLLMTIFFSEFIIFRCHQRAFILLDCIAIFAHNESLIRHLHSYFPCLIISISFILSRCVLPKI